MMYAYGHGPTFAPLLLQSESLGLIQCYVRSDAGRLEHSRSTWIAVLVEALHGEKAKSSMEYLSLATLIAKKKREREKGREGKKGREGGEEERKEGRKKTLK